MTYDHRLLLRNIEEPILETPHSSLFKIVSQCVHKIQTVSRLKVHPTRCLPIYLEINSTCSVVKIKSHTPSSFSHFLSFSSFSSLLRYTPFNPFDFSHLINILQPPYPPLPSPLSSNVINALLWLFAFQLFSISFPPEKIFSLVFLLCSSIHHSNIKFNKPNIKSFLAHYSNYIFVRVDHNHRQIAAICPVILHHFTKQIFIDDTFHFKLIADSSVHQILHLLRSRIQELSHWKHLCNSSTVLPNPWLMVKQDGKRWRPLCSYAGALHKRFLSIFSFALTHVLRLSGIHHFALFHSFNSKDHVADFNSYCSVHGSKIFKFSFDVKNFYTEINKDLLLYRVGIILKAYRDRHHVNFVSFPKRKSKILDPLPAFSTDPKYFCISLDDLVIMIKIALDFAYYGLGVHIIHQIIGLAMGCPFSPPLAILYLAFDEHMSRLPKFNDLYRKFMFKFLLERYMDDLILLVAVSADLCTAKAIPDNVAHYVQFMMYDQISGLLTLNALKKTSSWTTLFLLAKT